MAGLSCVGSHERVRIAWPCEKRYACFLPAVCDGDSHCSAAACGEVRVLDHDLGDVRRQRDRERLAEDRVPGAERVAQRVTEGVGDLEDREVGGVEHQRRRRAGPRQRQRRRPGERLRREVGGQVERDVRDARLLGPGGGVRIARDGRGGGRRGRRRSAHRRGRGVTAPCRDDEARAGEKAAEAHRVLQADEAVRSRRRST